jgi:PPOX class probable F420-dependent enzyme
MRTEPTRIGEADAPRRARVTDPALTIHPVLTDELRDWLTAELRYPVLAVVNDRGAPSQSVMWFAIDPERPDTILMNTRTDRAKARYLRANPRVSVCFEERYRWVALHGTAELDDEPVAALADIKALARRYDDDPEVFNGQQRVTIRIRVDKVISHE